jgi:hypothetical protein
LQGKRKLKRKLKRLTKESGVTIKAYRANNGIFAKSEIKNSANNKGQVLTFSGVGVLNQKGVAERYIRTLT